MTGLSGRYDIVFELDPADTGAEPGADPDGNPLVAPYRRGLRKMGLALERGDVSVERLVIDHVEKKPTEN